WGPIEGRQVPMLEGQCCGHDGVCTYPILEQYQRFWLDVDRASALWQWIVPQSAPASANNGVPRWTALSVYARSTNASSRSNLSFSKGAVNPSAMLLPSSNSTACGCGCRARRRPSSWTNASAS